MGSAVLDTALWILGVLAVWGAVRVVLEAVVIPPRHNNANTVSYFSEEFLPLVADRDLGVWNRSNHRFIKHTAFAEVNLTTEVIFDSSGARVSHAGDETPPEVDIIVVGESNSWGQGLPNEKTYAALLGQSLRMSVANYSLINSNGVQNLLTAQRFKSRRPKIIVFPLFEGHFTTNVVRCASIDAPICLGQPIVRRGLTGKLRVSRPWLPRVAFALYTRWYREAGPTAPPRLWRDIGWVLRAKRRWIMDRLSSNVQVRAWKYLGQPAGSPLAWKALVKMPFWPSLIAATKFVVTEMKRLADSVNAKLVVVYFPLNDYVSIDPPPDEIVSLAEQSGIVFVRMDRVWRIRAEEAKSFLRPLDMHFNELGHQDIAREIAAALQPPARPEPALVRAESI